MALDELAAVHALAEEVEERELQRLVGGEATEDDAELGAGGFYGGAVGVELAAVVGADGVGVNVEFAARFEVAEERGLGEVEAEFRRVERGRRRPRGRWR